VSGFSNGPEDWKIDLSAYAGKSVEVSISYASDGSVQAHGVFVDDITSSTGEGATSFENDGDTLDGWTVPGAPAGSPGNDTDFTVGTVADVPPSFGTVARASFAREPEILKFLASKFGPYPFKDAGGIVDNLRDVGFALENQTRPIYAQEFFYDQIGGDSVVVHELAHQWYGDSVSVHHWADIWLNEGFATYAEWMWSEQEGLGTAQEIFDANYEGIPADDPFWTLTIGDPGPEDLFDNPVYTRGGMTLHVLRLTVGDDAFFTILRKWASMKRGGNGSIAEFIALSEHVSHQNLDALFDAWLFTPAKPAAPASAALASPALSAFAQQTMVGAHAKRTLRH
jgi:peptidase M1-like protein/immune inhibitor InhA-like protein